MFVQKGFWTLRATPSWPCPQGLHQNSECVPPVLIHRAITCDSFKVLSQKAYEELCDNKKKDPKSYFLTSSDPWHAHGSTFLHHCVLLSITFDWHATWLFVQNDFWTFWATSTPLALSPVVTSKFQMCSSSLHPYGYHLWKFWDSCLNGLGALVWHYRWMYGWYHNIPAFSSKTWG